MNRQVMTSLTIWLLTSNLRSFHYYSWIESVFASTSLRGEMFPLITA